MTNYYIRHENIEIWPSDVKLMVEQGYFNPMQETPLKNHDWRDDVPEKYHQMKVMLDNGQAAQHVKAPC